jgi:5-methylcytosine-specific restriction endonuclease McrA
MWRKIGVSLPQGEAKCQPCRREIAPPQGRTVPVEVQYRRMDEARRRERDKTCDCGKAFKGSAMRKKCDACRGGNRSAHYRKKNAKRQNRASGRLYLDTGELITIAALGDRDKWTCWLCSEFVNRALGNRDPWMPSFDHVQPISLGGLDSWDNLKLAHLICNIKRGNRVAA